MAKKNGHVDRPQTGIEGLDDVLNGGLARERSFLLEGSPGTGKTTIALQFLLAGAAAGERGLYVTMSETEDELRTSAASHGWNLDGVEVYELVPPETLLTEDQQQSLLYSSDLELGETTKRIFAAFDRLKPHRVVIDSLSEIRLLAQSSLRYRRQILAMKHFFTQRGATVLLLDDLTTETEDKSVHSVAHGVIRLEETRAGIRLRPASAARPQVSRQQIPRRLPRLRDPPGGVRVFPRLVSAEYRRNFKRDVLPAQSQELNKLLGGGVERGSSVLILGPAGAGKSIMALTFAVSAIERGERVALFIFDEEIGLLIDRSLGLGIDLEAMRESGQPRHRCRSTPRSSRRENSRPRSAKASRTSARRPSSSTASPATRRPCPRSTALILHMHELLQYLQPQRRDHLPDRGAARAHGRDAGADRPDLPRRYRDPAALFRGAWPR